MSKFQAALQKKKLSAKSDEPKAKKSSTYEEQVTGELDKALNNWHDAVTNEATAKAERSQAESVVRDAGLSRMWERQDTQNITFRGSKHDLYVAFKDQYSMTVEKAEEFKKFLQGKGQNPDDYIEYEESTSLKTGDMTEKEITGLVNYLHKSLGQKRMDEILSTKTTVKIKGLAAQMVNIAESEEEFHAIRAMSGQHKPTVNAPAKPKPAKQTKKKTKKK